MNTASPSSYPTEEGSSKDHTQASTSKSAPKKGKGKSPPSVKKDEKRDVKEVASPQSDEEDDVDDKKGLKKKGKKRRRVVVACDTCRRKKVKCEGLPNATTTCDNCQNFGYACTFTVEPDRSRGRYEILEAQKDTVLAALRHVAPELAEQFDRGELTAGSLNELQTDQGTHWTGTGDPSFVSGDREEASSEVVPPSGEQDGRSHSREPKRDLGPMIPDLEDGRPRYYGGSSNLNAFHHLDSRPPSPGTSVRQKHAASRVSDPNRGRPPADVSSTDPRLLPGEASSVNRLAVLPRPRPLYPSNSIGWVRHVRKKTLVAIGRDDLYGAEGWFQRYHFPETGLLNQLLDLFFQQLNPLLPIIHEQSLRKNLAQGRAEKDSAFRGLVFTIIAIASRFLPNDSRVLADQNDPDSAGDHWAAASRFHHQVYAASLINVQVLLLTSTFMPSTMGVGTSWTVLGVAIRALQDIGLHTERAYSEYTPFEQEMRRRAFWAASVLDNILSINLGRPSALRLADTLVHFPLLASEEALTRAEAGGPIEEQSPFDLTPCPVAGFIHLIKLNVIVQDVINDLYAPRWRTDVGQQGKVGPTLKTQQKSTATYKDMMILSKRLDDWVADIPGHLQSIETSPYKLQAGILQCGRHDVRLYILKPFLQDFKPSFPHPIDRGMAAPHEGSILKKMLMPQCASHARECLRLLAVLTEQGHLTHMVFVMQQAFLSAATFMLTVWHETRNAETLSQDRDLIEATLSMLRPEENRYCSALLRRAQRILCNIAQRVLVAIPDDEQRSRMQCLIQLHGDEGLGDGLKLFGGAGPVTESSHARHHNGKEEGGDAENAAAIGGQGESMWSRGSAAADQDRSRRYNGPAGSLPHSTAVKALLSDPFTPIDSKTASPSKESNYLDQENSAFGQWPPFDDNLASSTLLDDFGDTSQFAGSQLNWTDYFSRFLGGLPNPGNTPPFHFTNGVGMSPLVNQTP